MVKRTLAVMLTLAMLITGMTFGASAATYEKIDGANYIKVSTEAELLAALKTGGNIMLQNDIEITSKNAISMKPETLINGNGYSLIYKPVRLQQLFKFEDATVATKSQITFKNLNIGTKETPFQMQDKSLFTFTTKARMSEVDFQNVNFYVTKVSAASNTAALFVSTNTVVRFEGCMLDIQMTKVTGGGLHGGWISSIDTGSQVTFKNCVTTGNITAPGGAGAFVAQNTSGELVFEKCTNFANVTGGGYVGGFLANVGQGSWRLYFTDCVNYGTVKSTGTGYGAMAGGFVGRMSNRPDDDGRRLNVIYHCTNRGTIISGGSAGGFVGRFHDYDYLSQPYFTFSDCINYGPISGDEYAGGIMGVSSPLVYMVEMTDCANLGKIISSKGYAGNFGGLISRTTNPTFVRCYAAGVLAGKTNGMLVGCSSGQYTVGAGDLTGRKYDVVHPRVESAAYYGPLTDEIEGVVKVTEMKDMLAAAEALGAQFGETFIMPDSNNKNAYLVAATPQVKGVQQSVSVVDNLASLRFAAAIGAKDAYSAYGFEITMTSSAGTTTKTYKSFDLYQKLSETTASGKGSISAANNGYAYYFTAQVNNVPTGERVIFKVTPYAISSDGETTYTGSTKLITVQNGMIVNESLMINGIMLEDFVIVYDEQGKMAEKTLAEHMTNDLAELTGIALPMISTTTKTKKTAKIYVGKQAGMTDLPAGRNISTVNDGTGSIVFSGDTTAQLGEAVQYALDTLAEMVNKGENVLDIKEPIAVPVDTKVSIMAFNMGAQDNAQVKKHEWELIVDYLPDIVTCQEPWAGFLDDFLNDYAVQPETDFKASTADDDVMSSDVNNKAFTGNGYYGVYWGLPRWTPSDPNKPEQGYSKHAGKASYSVILYAKDRFEVDESKSGTFWLSDRPSVSNSMYIGSSFARCATYATLTDKNTGEQFVVVNVHLDFDEKIQVPSVETLLTELTKRVGTDQSIFITGDMNSTATSKTIKYYFDNEIMPMTSLDDISYESYRYRRNIDWLLTNKPEDIDVTYFRYCGEWNFFNSIWDQAATNPIGLHVGTPSDHPAMYAEFTFKK